VDDVVGRSRFRARSLASSIFSRGVRELLCAWALPLALSRCWEAETVLEAAVMESRSLWNLRFEVAIASGMVGEWSVVSCIYDKGRGERTNCSNKKGCVFLCLPSMLSSQHETRQLRLWQMSTSFASAQPPGAKDSARSFALALSPHHRACELET